MSGVCGANKIIERQIKGRAQFLELLSIVVDVSFSTLPFLIGLLRNFLPVLVGAGIKKHLVTPKTSVAGEGVGYDHFVSKANVRVRIDVRQGGGDVARFIFHNENTLTHSG